MTDRDMLARQHLGLVHALCKRFVGKGIEYEELFSAGCLGLSKAINNFDESRNLQFSTYAFPVIIGELKRLFRDGGAVKVSRSVRELSLKAARLNSESLKENGAELSVSQLAEKLNVSAEKIVEALGSARAPLSLTAEYDEDGNPQLDVPIPDIQDEISERLSLEQALNALEEQDRRLIRLGDDSGSGKPQRKKDFITNKAVLKFKSFDRGVLIRSGAHTGTPQKTFLLYQGAHMGAPLHR